MRKWCLGAMVLAASAAGPAWAGYKIGSPNTAVIEPPVPHPAETPCVVTLFANAQFGANNAPISYTPPAACAGPWARVVLSLDIGLDAGIQYDRTGTVWLGGVNLWFGTSSEPTPNVAPQWHIERDVTNDTALLAQPQTGFALIANYTNSTDTSIITASGSLLFYPASSTYPAPATPDLVLPLAAAGGGTVALSSSSSTLSTTITLPTNVQGAALDLYLQSQGGDEFWYSCVPNNLSGPLNDCGGGAFREGEIAIDGTPAGVAPIYPWIYTGGVDPYLWAPLPGVQTLDFKPFRVELTPFAALLSNGQPHTVSVSVFGSNNYFSAAGVLYVTLDHSTTQVTGSVLKNTLSATPNPATKVTGGGTQTGILTTDLRNFTISGVAVTSAGPVTTTVQEASRFKNDQNFDITNTLYRQLVRQDTQTSVSVTQKTGAASTAIATSYDYPLTLNFVEHIHANGSAALATAIDQAFNQTVLNSANGVTTGTSTLSNAIAPRDTLLINSAGQLTGNKNQSSMESYIAVSSDLGCLKRTLAAAANILTAASTSASCK